MPDFLRLVLDMFKESSIQFDIASDILTSYISQQFNLILFGNKPELIALVNGQEKEYKKKERARKGIFSDESLVQAKHADLAKPPISQ